MRRCDAEKRAEGGVPGAASIEAEDELVEVGLEVFATQAVIDAERPALEIHFVARMGGMDALSPARAGVTRCGRTPGVPAPAFGSEHRPRWPPRSPAARPFADAAPRR